MGSFEGALQGNSPTRRLRAVQRRDWLLICLSFHSPPLFPPLFHDLSLSLQLHKLKSSPKRCNIGIGWHAIITWLCILHDALRNRWRIIEGHRTVLLCIFLSDFAVRIDRKFQVDRATRNKTTYPSSLPPQSCILVASIFPLPQPLERT